MRTIFIFLLTILCAGPALAQDSVMTLLERASQGMRGTHSLEAAFRQEKHIPFLDLPLMAEGKLCFHVPGSSSPYVFWEYRAPSRSGFQYEDDSIRIWSETSQKDVSAAEKSFLKALVTQMLHWISFDRKALEKEYALAPVMGKERALMLTPRKASSVFKTIELEFSEDFATLARIAMVGPQDDQTLLTFQPQSINVDLSGDCRR